MVGEEGITNDQQSVIIERGKRRRVNEQCPLGGTSGKDEKGERLEEGKLNKEIE